MSSIIIVIVRTSARVGWGRRRLTYVYFFSSSLPIFIVRLCYTSAVIIVRPGYTASLANPSCFVWSAIEGSPLPRIGQPPTYITQRTPQDRPRYSTSPKTTDWIRPNLFGAVWLMSSERDDRVPSGEVFFFFSVGGTRK
jgi:hypothetical protein